MLKWDKWCDYCCCSCNCSNLCIIIIDIFALWWWSDSSKGHYRYILSLIFPWLPARLRHHYPLYSSQKIVNRFPVHVYWSSPLPEEFEFLFYALKNVPWPALVDNWCLPSARHSFITFLNPGSNEHLKKVEFLWWGFFLLTLWDFLTGGFINLSSIFFSPVMIK